MSATTTPARRTWRNEAEFTASVIQLAQTCGWLAHHSRPALTAKGYRTAIQGNAGLPDIVLAKDGRVLLMELKMPRGAFQPGQREWLAASGGYLFYPSDWERITELVGEGRIVG